MSSSCTEYMWVLRGEKGQERKTLCNLLYLLLCAGLNLIFFCIRRAWLVKHRFATADLVDVTKCRIKINTSLQNRIVSHISNVFLFFPNWNSRNSVGKIYFIRDRSEWCNMQLESFFPSWFLIYSYRDSTKYLIPWLITLKSILYGFKKEPVATIFSLRKSPIRNDISAKQRCHFHLFLSLKQNR